MKLEVADNKIKTFALDHHGLVAGICQDLNLAGKIDERLGKKDPRLYALDHDPERRFFTTSSKSQILFPLLPIN